MEEQLSEISKKLSILIYLNIKTADSKQDNKSNIKMLDSFKLSNSEIASILDMQPNAVSMAKSRMKGQDNDKSN